MKEVRVEIVDYNLFEYEKKFLKEEIEALGGVIVKGKIERKGSLLIENLSVNEARKLTFVREVFDGEKSYPSIQSIRESFNGKSVRVQSRRYGPHGLHEYKGRFNPQMPRSLILSNFAKGAVIIDPFMGSGTALVEARDLGYKAIGVELNPLAYLLAKAKKVYEELPTLGEIKWRRNKISKPFYDVETRKYLLSWFPENEFRNLEFIQQNLSQLTDDQKIVARVILSDLLRNHSLQDPNDLRIRRRKEIPDGPDLLEDFKRRFGELSKKHSGWIKKIKQKKTNEASLLNSDSRTLSKFIRSRVNGSVSSPPYASALPYVDTYRLSMIALGLIKPNEILKKEKELIGSRDVSNTDKELLTTHLSELPLKVGKLIRGIQNSIKKDSSAGFRKKAVPYSLARYYFSMLSVLRELYTVEDKGSQNLWVLGPNKVKLAGEWLTMDTPALIGELAKMVGFKNISVEAVQAYNRYGLHSKNSINKESILRFEK